MSLPHRWLKILALCIVTIICIVTFYIWQIQQEFFKKPLVQTDTIITLPKASSARKLSEILYAKGMIQSPKFFLGIIRYYQLSSLLKSGSYLIQPQDTAISLLHKIIQGRVYTVNVKMIEGQRLCEYLKEWSESHEYQFHDSMLNDLQQGYASLEGLFYPSTYIQPYGESILPVLKLSRKKMDLTLNQIWQTRDSGLPYANPYELLIAASIIEKETAIDSERRLISGVIINRLRLKMPLQMDPTVVYGMPGCGHVILKGRDIKIDSPYNSYLHKGLPPTPIAMVSEASLQAAAHPQKTTYLYFVANGHGQHVFSVEYQQQKNAIAHIKREENVD